MDNANTDEKNKEGRPTKYDESIHPRLAKWMRRSGLTDKQIAGELGICEATYYNWCNEHPEFLESTKQDKEFVDYLVEDSLLKKALGYKYEESKSFGMVNEEGKIVTARAEKTMKEVPPDSTACIFWLKNRQPTKWRDKTDVSVFDGEAQIDRDEKARVMREEMIKKFSVDES